MGRLAVVLCLALTAGCAEEWVTYENAHFGYAIEMPDDFEVQENLLFQDVAGPGTYDFQQVNLVAWDRVGPAVVEIRVNGYEAPLREKTIYVFYDFTVQEDGSIVFVDRWLNIPDGDYTSVRAMSLFINPDTKDVHSFGMELWDDHEELFFDIVSSFRLTNKKPHHPTGQAAH